MTAPIPFRQAVAAWTRVALQSFGGPAGQIAVMHRIVVEEQRWVDEPRFLHALNYCMLLPGPEAQQLATYMGWLLHGTRGGLVAGILFILPGFLAILALSLLYAAGQGMAAVTALFFGLKAAVLAVVVQALVRIGKKVLRSGAMATLSVLSFVAIFLFGVPFPWIVIAAAALGLLAARARPLWFPVLGHAAHDAEGAAPAPPHTRPSRGRALRVLAVCLLLWWAPIAALALLCGEGSVFTRAGLFFSEMAVVTFGGAYAVLAYVAQQAVEHYGWLSAGEMLDGLGLAETTPGPLIMVVQFVGFLGAFRNPGGLDPYLAGVLGAVLTTWVTFVPCFLWIFLGAPYVERLRSARRLSAGLAAITAAVVGVIANLALWFCLHVLFTEVTAEPGPLGTRLWVPEPGSFVPAALVLGTGAMVALLRFRAGMFRVLAVTTAAGMGWHLLAG